MTKFDVIGIALLCLALFIFIGFLFLTRLTTIDCIKANSHRTAAEVNIVCGRP